MALLAVVARLLDFSLLPSDTETVNIIAPDICLYTWRDSLEIIMPQELLLEEDDPYKYIS